MSKRDSFRKGCRKLDERSEVAWISRVLPAFSTVDCSLAWVLKVFREWIIWSANSTSSDRGLTLDTIIEASR